MDINGDGRIPNLPPAPHMTNKNFSNPKKDICSGKYPNICKYKSKELSFAQTQINSNFT
jgi:hypothetical protein